MWLRRFRLPQYQCGRCSYSSHILRLPPVREDSSCIGFQTIDLQRAVSRIPIIAAVVGECDQSAAVIDCILEISIHCPSRAAERSRGIARNLLPSDGCGVVECTTPREVVTFLIHIDDGRRINITAIMLRLSGVVHHEIVTHIHATIGGHMRFKLPSGTIMLPSIAAEGSSDTEDV